MCSDLRLLHDVRTIKPPIQVFLSYGETLEVNYMGRAILSSTLTLCGVLYLPTFKFNLISVNRLCATSSLQFLFTTHSCYLQDLKSHKIIARGRLIGTLYILNTGMLNPITVYKDTITNNGAALHSSSTTFASPNVSTNMIDVSLWYRQLGHASITALHHIFFLLNKELPNIRDCKICPFSTSDISITGVFHFIHLDLRGLYRQKCYT